MKKNRTTASSLSSIIAGLALILGITATPTAAQTRLSPTEQLIVEAVDRRLDEGLELLRRVVNINSGTLNFEGVRAVGRIFKDELNELGFATHWVDGTPFGRAGHLVAHRDGVGPRILLIGHLDTVFEPDSPFQKYQQLTSTTARGPGIIDMKGGDVVIVQALKALQEVGILDSLSLTVVMTGDEEKAGHPREQARQALIEAAATSDIALGFEDGDGNPATAVVARRGSSSWSLQVAGTPAHSSQIFQPQFGFGAIFEAARVLNAFREELAGDELLTFNPGLILGGTRVKFEASQARGTAFGKENVIAEHAVVAGDLRCISPQQLVETQAAMRRITSESLPGTSSVLTFAAGGYPPMAPSAGNLALLERYSKVSRDLGLGPVAAVNPRNAGAADISFAAGGVEMALDGLGLMGRDGHTIQETADLSTLPTQTQRAAVLIYRLTRVNVRGR